MDSRGSNERPQSRRLVWVLALGGALALGATALDLWSDGGEQGAARDADPRWQVWSGELHRPSALEGLAYELVPSVERELTGWRVATNARGARDGEPLAEGDVFRVAALGSSFTFGWGLAVESRWTDLLERELTRSILVQGREVEFLDCAVAGYEVPEQVALLAGRVLDLNPWLVVLEHSLEDRGAPQLAALRSIGARGAQASVATIEALHDPEGAAWKAFSESLSKARDLCAPRGIPRVLVIVPRLGSEPWERYPYRELHAQVAREARRFGCEPLDLLESFEREPPQALALSPDDPSPNARAHALAADAFKRALYASGMLGQLLERH
jgi:hypothetical protein